MVERDDFLPAAGLVGVGMLLPVPIATVGGGLLPLYLSGSAFTALVAVGFGLLSWTVVEWTGLDRPSLGVAAVVVPGLSIFVVPLVVFILGADGGVRRYLFWDFPGLFAYAGAFATAGLGAVALSWAARRWHDRSPRSPSPRTVVVAVWLLLGSAVVVGAGASHLAAADTTIGSATPGLADGRDPALVTRLEDGPAELRLVVTAPDGTQVVRRVPPTAFADGGATVATPVVAEATPPPGRLPTTVGTYRVRVTSPIGLTVDTAEITVEERPRVTLLAADAVASQADWSHPGLSTPTALPDRRIYVGVLVGQTGGAFPTRPPVRVLAGDRTIGYAGPLVAPTHPGRLIVPLPEPVVEDVRSAHGGTIRVRVGPEDDPAAVTTLTLPPANTG